MEPFNFAKHVCRPKHVCPQAGRKLFTGGGAAPAQTPSTSVSMDPNSPGTPSDCLKSKVPSTSGGPGGTTPASGYKVSSASPYQGRLKCPCHLTGPQSPVKPISFHKLLASAPSGSRRLALAKFSTWFTGVEI